MSYVNDIFENQSCMFLNWFIYDSILSNSWSSLKLIVGFVLTMSQQEPLMKSTRSECTRSLKIGTKTLLPNKVHVTTVLGKSHFKEEFDMEPKSRCF